MTLSHAYRDQVENRLELPQDEARRYGSLAQEALKSNAVVLDGPQYVVVADRNPNVQAIFIYWIAGGFAPLLIGASPVSTGRVGQFDHFESPLGVFEHTFVNPDYRAEGTKNENGIRGYGAKGLRIFDFGWQEAKRGWGRGGVSTMRLQMHATDADLLEPRLGSVQSKGCIRIPAALNGFLDRFGVLDADYEKAQAEGKSVWVLAAARSPIADAGRYLIIVDSLRRERPTWSPLPEPDVLPSAQE